VQANEFTPGVKHYRVVNYTEGFTTNSEHITKIYQEPRLWATEKDFYETLKNAYNLQNEYRESYNK